MRTLVAAVLALALAVPAMAQEKTEAPDYSRVIAGGAVGWAVSGPDHDAGKTFYTYAWGGARFKKYGDGLSLFAVVQHININGVKSSSGAKIIASQPVPGASWLSLVFSGGFMSSLAVDIVESDIKGLPPEETDKAGFTFDFGPAITVERMLIVPILHVLDRGDAGTDVGFTLNVGLRLGS